MSVSILGIGWVGKAMKELFPDAYVYHPDRNNPEEVKQSREEANKADVAFICVPTPCMEEGKLDTSIVEECISWCKCPLIVVRSTTNPGDCESYANYYGKNVVHQPEYLGETPNHPLLDTRQIPFLIIGGKPKDRRKLIELYTTVYNANTKIREVTLFQSELIKLSENRAIAFKVAQCQELYDVCENARTDYYVIRDAVYGDDPRFNLWWTFIYPDKRGFNSKCIPKDIYAWCAWAETAGYKPEITRAILERNKKWIKS